MSAGFSRFLPPHLVLSFTYTWSSLFPSWGADLCHSSVFGTQIVFTMQLQSVEAWNRRGSSKWSRHDLKGKLWASAHNSSHYRDDECAWIYGRWQIKRAFSPPSLFIVLMVYLCCHAEVWSLFFFWFTSASQDSWPTINLLLFQI